MVRYRHGGDAAIYPILKQPIVGSRESAQAAVGTQTIIAETPAAFEDNVLDFDLMKHPVERIRPPRAPRGSKPKRRE